MQKKPIAKAAIGIQKPAAAIFEAIVNPDQMKHYFISNGSGRMEQGADLEWSFPEFEASYPVKVTEVEDGQRIVFVWDPHSIVKIELEPLGDQDTVVRVSEEGHQGDDEGIKWAIGQTEGWANFLACMKAWLEYSVPLRKGAFDFMKPA